MSSQRVATWEVLLALPDTGTPAPLPTETRAFLRRVARGSGGALLPPIAHLCPEGVVTSVGRLRGAEDARRLGRVLSRPAFAPLVALLEALGPWCRALEQTHAAVFRRGVLQPGNAALFAPLIGGAFLRCAVGRTDQADVIVDDLARFQGFLARFADRFQRDLNAGVFGERLRVPVVGVWANPSETHNGRQRVLCLRLRDGYRIAYKPRPVDGERIFLAAEPVAGRTSVFAWLNGLAPVSGPVRLPTLHVWRGRGRDRWAYSWQEWVERPRQWGTLRASPHLRVEGARLAPRSAAAYWRSAGALGAACYAFGITDLGEGNVLAGVRPGAPAPMPYIVDLEVFSCPLQRLSGTGLVAAGIHRSQTRPGFGAVPHWDDPEGPSAAFFASAGGALCLRRVVAPWGRDASRTAVADRLDRIGHAAYLLPMLRGMFDLWTCIRVHRDALLQRIAMLTRGGRVRVLPKLTATYARALERHLTSTQDRCPAHDDEGALHFSAEEHAQMARADVPYFFAPLDGGALQWLDGPDLMRRREAGAQQIEEPSLLPDPDILRGRNLDFVDLAVLLQDAVADAWPDLAQVVPDLLRDAGGGYRLRDPALGVDLRIRNARAGSACFDWPEAACRVRCNWNRRRVWLETLPPQAPLPRLRAVARRLLAIQRLDGVLRRQWAAGGFSDRETGRRLRSFTRTALAWFEEIVDVHGWPTRARVGAQACDAAATLVQHAGRGAVAFQQRCLGLMRDAAARGDVPLRHVAYLTDAVRLKTGYRQLYGTKFMKRGGHLTPCPIEQPEEVDARRRQMGLPPLAVYRDLLRRTYGGEVS